MNSDEELKLRGALAYQTGLAEGLKESVAKLKADNERLQAICDEIQRIMVVYREQEAKYGYVDTPGGLEHMGDVWRLLASWDAALAQPKPEPK